MRLDQTPSPQVNEYRVSWLAIDAVRRLKEGSKMERMFAVAVREGKDLFLWFRIRGAASGELYYMIPTGRTEAEWKKWDPHGSLHKDGRSHHKSFNQKLLPKKGQKPDANFKGTEPWIKRPIASGEPRTFGEVCNLSEFSEVMEIPVEMLSPKKYETVISIECD